MNLNQSEYNHISKKDLEEMCEVVSNLSKSLYISVDEEDLTSNCLIAESKFSFVPEVKYLVEKVKEAYKINYNKPSLIKMSDEPGENLLHMHTEELNKIVVLLKEFSFINYGSDYCY